MKKIYVFILSLLFSFTLSAQNWDRVVVVSGAAGAIVSSEYAIYQSLIKRELKGWASKETGTSVRLENQCGIETEFHLIGDYKRNYIMVGISNNSGEQVALNFRRVKFIVNQNSERYPGYSYQVSDELVNTGWWVLANIPLPRKSELATYDHFRVEIPVLRSGKKESCTIVTEFKRTSHVPKEEVSYNVFDFMFDLGPSLTQTGPVRKLGDPSSIWGMNFNWYFSGNHGAGMNFQWEYGFDKPKSGYSHSSIFSGDFHYVYRHLLSQKFSVNFEPGLGFQGLSSNYNNCRYCRNRNFDSTFMLDYRLMLQYVLGTWRLADIDILDYFIGAGIVQQYGVSGDTGGSRYGLLFRIGFGF